jgi:2-dehydro-3-deoxyphosphogluconate aldolase/(4S)-4-hydroxy-2-oxoglutarate aldolase
MAPIRQLLEDLHIDHLRSCVVKYRFLMAMSARPPIDTVLAEALERLPAIGILRGCPLESVTDVADSAAEAGFAVLEVTLDSPDPFESIARVSAASSTVVVGAGTVHTGAEAHQAIDAGARFVVSPIVSAEVIAACVDRSIPSIPGAATPTEISHALDLGAATVKVFPARELGGPSYLKAILGPLGRPDLIPTGGVGVDNAAAFLDAGARAVGVGGSVFPFDALRRGDVGQVGSLASALVRSIT